jgi:hypothetical protein
MRVCVCALISGGALLCAVLPSVLTVPTAKASARAAAGSTATRCFAATSSDLSTGSAAFIGNCNGHPIFLNAAAGSVLGRTAGLTTAFVGSTTLLSGRIGSWRTSYSLIGTTLTGRYGAYRMFFAVSGGRFIGHIGTARVSCFVRFSSLPASVLCAGAGGGAEALVPFLAYLYAAD